MFCDMAMPSSFGFPKFPQVSAKVSCEGGTIEIFNYPMPTAYHYITVEKRGEKARSEKVYTFAEGKMEGKGEDWWTTYRYQLEAFVDMLRGRTPQIWLDKEDAVANMEWVERIYAKVSKARSSCAVLLRLTCTRLHSALVPSLRLYLKLHESSFCPTV